MGGEKIAPQIALVRAGRAGRRVVLDFNEPGDYVDFAGGVPGVADARRTDGGLEESDDGRSGRCRGTFVWRMVRRDRRNQARRAKERRSGETSAKAQRGVALAGEHNSECPLQRVPGPVAWKLSRQTEQRAH